MRIKHREANMWVSIRQMHMAIIRQNLPIPSG